MIAAARAWWGGKKPDKAQTRMLATMVATPSRGPRPPWPGWESLGRPLAAGSQSANAERHLQTPAAGHHLWARRVEVAGGTRVEPVPVERASTAGRPTTNARQMSTAAVRSADGLAVRSSPCLPVAARAELSGLGGYIMLLSRTVRRSLFQLSAVAGSPWPLACRLARAKARDMSQAA